MTQHDYNPGVKLYWGVIVNVLEWIKAGLTPYKATEHAEGNLL